MTTAPAANTPPTITDIVDQFLPVNGHSGPRPFTVGDTETAVGALVVTVATSNPTYLPLSGLVLAGTGASRTVTLFPANGQSGTATVTLTVTDGAGLSASTSFAVSSTGLTAPTITTIPAQNLTGGSASPAIPFTVTDPAVTTLVLQASVTPSGALVAADCAFSGASGSRFLVITPPAAASGAFQVTVTVIDANGMSASTTFTATVTPASPGSPGSSGGGGSGGSGGGGGGGGCGLGSGAYALAGLFMLALRILALTAWRRRD